MSGTSTRIGALRLPLFSNIALVFLKLTVWLATGSVSILSEAVHSVADLVVTSFQLVSVRLAAQPADENHPYGHGKFENLSAAVEAVIILATAALVVAQAIAHLRAPVPLRHLDVGIGLMIFSAAVNVFVSRNVARVAEAEQSPVLYAETAQLRADVFTAGGVALGLISVRLTHATAIDPIMSLVVAGLIVKSAFEVSARAIIDLADRRLPVEEEQSIRTAIESHRDIFTGYHKLRTRRSGAGEFIDFHLQMRGDTPLQLAHDRSDAIVLDIKKIKPRAHVLIHLEPED
ncbi:MAG: cation transporter [Candidatus Eremiobacteraeota bacterium]|nr:cation transporter [Candidatus Eremiobacteraeota bacterium]MBC5826205.1 cation transporter [Candidatus Eremiobacteraeota bacterium]